MAVPLEANIDNAMVNFSKHNVSLVAVVSDVRRNGKNLIGYGFNSIGRFDNLSDGRASGPVVGAAFKAVEVRLRAWWVRLLPLPPYFKNS